MASSTMRCARLSFRPSRVVDVTVEPSQKTYKPGQKAKAKVKLTGSDGKPFLGSTVLTVYDKAVEYISGGSNVPDIKKTFWEWKRSHHPQTESSLDRWFANLTKPNEVPMQDLGVFGGEPRGMMMVGGVRTGRDGRCGWWDGRHGSHVPGRSPSHLWAG